MIPQSEITIRRGKRTKNFTIVDNAIITQLNLSVRARFTLIYLLSKSDNWALQTNDLRRVLGTQDRPLGRDTTYGVICEMLEAGYLEKEQLVQSNGRFQSLRYTVWDDPLSKTLSVGSKHFGCQAQGQVDSGRAHEPPPPENQDAYRAAPENGLKTEAGMPLPDIKEAATTPLPDLPDPGCQDLTKDRFTPRTSPLPPPAKSLGDGEAANRQVEFEEFWRNWPERERPKLYAAAEKLFLRLKATDRELAARLSPAYRALCHGGLKPALMIPFLRDREFLHLAEGPSITPDGLYRIQPGREEWGAWLNYYAQRFGPRRLESIEQLGFMLTPSRWPPSQHQSPHPKT